MNKLFGGQYRNSVEIRPVFHDFGNFCMGFCFKAYYKIWKGVSQIYWPLLAIKLDLRHRLNKVWRKLSEDFLSYTPVSTMWKFNIESFTKIFMTLRPRSSKTTEEMYVFFLYISSNGIIWSRLMSKRLKTDRLLKTSNLCIPPHPIPPPPMTETCFSRNFESVVAPGFIHVDLRATEHNYIKPVCEWGRYCI
jgi:hypothetical protein